MQDLETDSRASGDRRPLALLAVGALLGLGMAVAGATRPSLDELPGDAIAAVNQRVIRADHYERAWRRVASDKRNPMSDADRARVLKRLIEEELLIQRGEAIGLVESDAAVRKSISIAMIQSIVAESEARKPDEADLREFYRENRRYFAPVGTLHVRQLVFEQRPGEERSERSARASAAREALQQGGAFGDVRARYADAPLLEIPDGPLPEQKLQQYVGPSLVEGVRALRPLEVSEPLEFQDDLRLFQLVAATRGEAPPFETIRDQVEGAFQRDAADRALRRDLARLWREADVRLGQDAPDVLSELD